MKLLGEKPDCGSCRNRYLNTRESFEGIPKCLIEGMKL